MKSRITKTANGHKLEISHEDWIKVGQQAGWQMQAQPSDIEQPEQPKPQQNPDLSIPPGKVQKSLTARERNLVNKQIHQITQGYHDKIPLQGLFDALKNIGIEAVQEDGTKWTGMLMGGKECGHPEAAKQRANIDLVRIQGRTPLNNSLFLTWCKMQSGKYEVVSYVS